MTTDTAIPTALEHAEQMGVLKIPTLTYGYYRQPDGWITVSPATAMEELRYRREKWEPLTQYGRVEMGTRYMAEHPLEYLFMQGGARELGRDQIIKMALHLNPPLIPTCRRPLSQHHKAHNAQCWAGAERVTFPQLGDDIPEGVPCRFCGRDPFPTDEARAQHETVMHKDEKNIIRSGEVMADSMITGLKGAQPVPQQNTAAMPYLCGNCGLGFTNPMKLAQHFKGEHKSSE